MTRTVTCGIVILALFFAHRVLADCNDVTAVDAARAAADAQCDCATAIDHAHYVKCVAAVANARARSHSLPRRCRRAVIRCAAKSACGTPDAVTCCIPQERGTADAELRGVPHEAEDTDAESSVPATCTVVPSAAVCAAAGGTVGGCPSCCDACGVEGCATTTSSPPATTTSTTRPSSTTRPATTTTSTPVARATTTTTLGPQTHTVTVVVGQGDGLTFTPSVLTINRGDTVHWVFASDGHNVVGGMTGVPDGRFCSPSDTNCRSAPLFNAGATYDHTFTTTGTFPYYCSPHFALGMTGTITVQ